MLHHTFRHIPGIGERTERRLWHAGVTTWEHLLDDPAHPVLRRPLRDRARFEVERSQRALARGDARYFTARLPHALRWRLYPAFAARVGYLDIETTGLGFAESILTVVGLYTVDADGGNGTPRVYVQGRNLDRFATDVADCTLLVTFNGAQFDLPFLRGKLGLPLDQAHIDLRYPLAALGYTGGLKKIETRLGLDRGGLLAKLDGWCAVVLWRYAQRGEPSALDTLLRYNLEDVVHLPTLLATAYNAAVERLPFPVAPATVPDSPAIPFAYDESVILRVLAETGRPEPADGSPPVLAAAS